MNSPNYMFWLIDEAWGYIVFNMDKKWRQARLTPRPVPGVVMQAGPCSEATANFDGSTFAGLTGIVTPARRRAAPERGGQHQTVIGQQ
ncbi:hypothetical protein [Paraburkholderia heleia]|uniref:hypothetical protein n=1 Tax=Paraburkholderia heleia TaxID=634127 RepID=UPI0012EDE0B7|nr:hypothetical protein [Paraburkholderia heleia]